MEAENSETTNGAKPRRPGGYKPGQSGNRGGRPKLTPKALEVRALCREASVRAVERLRELLEKDDAGVVLRAAEAILSRAWGTPGSEAEVRSVDYNRLEDAAEREDHKRGRGGVLGSLAREDDPPPDVD